MSPGTKPSSAVGYVMVCPNRTGIRPMLDRFLSSYRTVFHVRKGPRYQGSRSPHGDHLGPVGPRWAPCWPHKPCYKGRVPQLLWAKRVDGRAPVSLPRCPRFMHHQFSTDDRCTSKHYVTRHSCLDNPARPICLASSDRLSTTWRILKCQKSAPPVAQSAPTWHAPFTCISASDKLTANIQPRA